MELQQEQGCVEIIQSSNKILAIIVRVSLKPSNNIHFFTPNEFSQQLAYMHHSAGKVIPAHIHNPVSRNVMQTQEVLFIKKESLKMFLIMAVDLFLICVLF